MAYENTGYLAFANSLSGLGQNIAAGLDKRWQQQSLSSLAPMLQTGDYAGAAKTAFDSGNQDLGIKLAMLDAEKRKTAEQRAYDAQALQGIDGLTGGVTPNPQPMNLPGAMPDKSAMSQYIVEAAKARGIDPGVALKVAQSEGMGGYTGDQNSSFGPFQLHYGGVAKGGNAVPGLGDEFTKQTGLDARNPQTWKQQVDFSLDQAKKGGWGPWHGWKGDQWAGLRGGAPQGVQVADASGAIPASAMPGQAPQAGVTDQRDALMSRYRNITAELEKRPGLSDNARQQWNQVLNGIKFEIEQLDKRTAQVKPEMKQFGDTVYRVEGGTMTPVQKIEKTAQEKALTADQSNAAGFADRMLNAEKVLADPELMKSVSGATGVQNQALGNVPLVGQKWQSAEFKRYDRAKKDFITAVLRKESGASISPTEFANEDAKYFPQPWDDEQTLADKAQARQIAISSMKRASGPAQGASPSQSVAGGGALDAAASDHLARARKAIADGIPREEVLRTLQSLKVDPSGL